MASQAVSTISSNFKLKFATFLLMDDDDGIFDHVALSNECEIPALAISTLWRTRKRKRISRYIEDTVPEYTLDTFKTFFRISRTTFEHVLSNIADFPELKRREVEAGRPQIPLEKDLLMFLWYMGSLESVRSIADRFDVSESTFVSHNRQILDVFCSYLKEKFIKWPSENEYRTISDEFQKKKGFPGIIGAIDGTHIEMKAPFDHQADYYNRKKYHSVVLQAICREDMTYIDILAGWPGRVHDARILKNSQIWRKGNTLLGQYCLVGDAAYPCRRWLLTPYRDNGNLNRNQVYYNKCLSGSRIIIEHSFATLKGRFRRLQFIDMANMEFIVKCIVSACILHNICLIESDLLEDIFNDNNQPDNPPDPILENDAEGPLRRLHITNVLSQQR